MTGCVNNSVNCADKASLSASSVPYSMQRASHPEMVYQLMYPGVHLTACPGKR